MAQLMAPAAAAGVSGALRERTSVTEVHRGGLTKSYPDRDASAEPIPFGSRGSVRRAMGGCPSADHASRGEELVSVVIRTRRGTVKAGSNLVGSTLHRVNCCPFELDSV